MLKVGDKLLCKKTYEHNRFEGKYYTIIGVKDDYVYFNEDNYHYDWYSLDSNSPWYIWDYFYKSQKVRKMKLNKLNNVKSR